MTNKWRPEGWKNPHSNLGIRTKNHKKFDAFESGADAMLEALMKDGTHVKRGMYVKHGMWGEDVYGMIQTSGIAVIIPDDTEDK
jgi:hypothetical protein